MSITIKGDAKITAVSADGQTEISVEEFARLQAENKRLRAALDVILLESDDGVRVRQFAREALRQ